jgi:hypothetical protein
MPEDDLEFVRVFEEEEDLSEMEADTLKSLLEANGINAVIVGAEMLPSLPYEIRVPRSQRARAREIIEEALDAGAQAAEEGEAASENQP